jgi:NAD(P)-dependent dehydrogenase (short-subunit alcohol dehydrogenase family)
MMSEFEGKIVVVTGGGTGIGLAAARRFAREGAEVYITGRRQEVIDAAAADIGMGVRAVRADSAVEEDLDRLYEQISREHGRVDVVFANAGLGEFAGIGEYDAKHIDKIFSVNVIGVINTVQKALPLMPDGGAIVLTGSIASSKGFPRFGVYNASKAAVRSFARTWANDLKEREIRVNVVSPGTIETDVFAPGPLGDAKDFFVSLIPRGRIGEPEEVANAALFLASAKASFINGVELFVDGGTIQI